MALLGQFKRDTFNNWINNNPILADGEFILISSNPATPTTYDSWTCGDGVSHFRDLPIGRLFDSTGIQGITSIEGDSEALAASQKFVTQLIERVQLIENSKWYGTQEEYDAIENPNPNVEYNIYED